MYRRIRLWTAPSDNSWKLDEVQVLRTPAERLRGFVGSPVMLFTRSIHTFTMRHPLSIVVLNRAGTVVQARVIDPRRLTTFTATMWVVETHVTDDMPLPGTRVRAFNASE
ncbi:MAG: hypothetical protein E2O95_02235 [Acidobacteria bacterium]|nr:MAG: hypothetical protein E2O95_02235 [Acidobacteriota bacterium]